MTTRRRFVRTLAVASGAAACSPLMALRSLAQPVNQVKILYGFPAGSSGDQVARRVGEKFAGTPLSRNGAIVDNRPGAGGRVALELLRSSPADGSVLALSPASAVTIYPHTYTTLNYVPSEFVPISTAAYTTFGLAVGPAVPASVKTLRDFIAWARTNPAAANFGSPGSGSAPHFLGALLAMGTGIDLRHVPYRGSLPAVNEVIGGQIASSLTVSGDYLPFVKAGKLRVLATSGKARSPYLPDVPTFTELGFPELVVDEWFGFFGPAGISTGVVAAAANVINNALKDTSIASSLLSIGLVAKGSTPEEMKRTIDVDYKRWEQLVKKVGFTAQS